MSSKGTCAEKIVVEHIPSRPHLPVPLHRKGCANEVFWDGRKRVTLCSLSDNINGIRTPNKVTVCFQHPQRTDPIRILVGIRDF